ncbi:hypothetical protein KUCAC02_033159, partial [Chaenocephalus aceratus]
ATSQPDLETWVTALHSARPRRCIHGGGRGYAAEGRSYTAGGWGYTAAAASAEPGAAGEHREGRQDEENGRNLQLSVIREANSRRAVQNQIQQWDQNLEQLNLDLFPGDEPPNPKNLLAVATRPSKCMLGRLGVFSVNSFHALVCSRGQLPDTTKGRTSTSTSTQFCFLFVTTSCRERETPGNGYSEVILLFRPLEDDTRITRNTPKRKFFLRFRDAFNDPFRGAGGFMVLSAVIRAWQQDDERASSLRSVERVHALYQTFPECRAAEPDVPRNPYLSPPHLSPEPRPPEPPPPEPPPAAEEGHPGAGGHREDLESLFDLYLTPLQTQSFLSKEEVEALFGCLPEMLDFQRVFRRRGGENHFLSNLEAPEQLQNCSRRSAGRSLLYADRFKHYAASAPITRRCRRSWREQRQTQPLSTSWRRGIRPISTQRLWKALRAMEDAASHINEMQKIYEEFGCVVALSMGGFLLCSSVLWLNPLPSLRLKKEPELTLFVFKRAVVLVYRENIKLKKRMTASRPADLDPFRFRWLIPVSQAQVRPANFTGSGSECVLELVHCRSEVEGRPETVFQLCSSDVEMKARVLCALRPLLRARDPCGSLRRPRLSAQRRHRGRGGEEPALPPDGNQTPKTRLSSVTGGLEAQLQNLHFTEGGAEPRGAGRRSYNLRGEGGELGGLLERDYSVHSMTSIISEDCFYDGWQRGRKQAPGTGNTLQTHKTH